MAGGNVFPSAITGSENGSGLGPPLSIAEELRLALVVDSEGEADSDEHACTRGGRTDQKCVPGALPVGAVGPGVV